MLRDQALRPFSISKTQNASLAHHPPSTSEPSSTDSHGTEGHTTRAVTIHYILYPPHSLGCPHSLQFETSKSLLLFWWRSRHANKVPKLSAIEKQIGLIDTPDRRDLYWAGSRTLQILETLWAKGDFNWVIRAFVKGKELVVETPKVELHLNSLVYWGRRYLGRLGSGKTVTGQSTSIMLS